MIKSHYENGRYIDVTTNRSYPPPRECVLCGSTYNLSYHHFMSQQKCIRDLRSKKVIYPNTWSKEKIEKNQKLFAVCVNCHSDIEHMSADRFLKKYGIELSTFKYEEKE